ncbi:hypothetical protein VIGAN_08218000 [Vigna angularis var. angularis]|uniref:Uncharacterized protein n=1 Tax=Vigna angularis var. angularis TaxID=157739 RepID=A0A0S3SRJ0_PHAAN|nr:hypothetical protein VIGAN_08218000 [Vigna angularis var. angularis]
MVNYDSFITSILSLIDSHTVEEIESLLLSREKCFDKQKINNDNIPLQAYLTSGPSSSNNNYNSKNKAFHCLHI